MEMYERTIRLSTLLKSVAEELDIPENRYLEAKKRYENVGEWLNKKDSPLARYNPVIYPQGSFRLGTVIKPVSNRDEYDIDLVCFLTDLQKEDISQRQLKDMVGNRLAQNETYKRLLDKEGRRCWTLNYANEFHMDILPAIADADLRRQGGFYEDAILITDKVKMGQDDLDWPKSNPEGYAKWFLSRQESIFMARKKQLAELLRAAVNDVPDYKVRTPLQMAVQILKRHRDIYFSRMQGDHKPISIIITTLAAIIYEGQDNVYNAIYDILQQINEDRVRKEGMFCISNPVNPDENFADKWNEDSNLPSTFFDWVDNARSTFCEDIIGKEDDLEIGRMLKEKLGNIGSSNVKRDDPIAPTYIKVKKPQERRPWGLNG